MLASMTVFMFEAVQKKPLPAIFRFVNHQGEGFNICQHVVKTSVQIIFMVNYMENVVHVHAVNTRPSLPLLQSEDLGTRLGQSLLNHNVK